MKKKIYNTILQKKKESLSFSPTWVSLEDIILNNINQTQKDKIYLSVFNPSLKQLSIQKQRADWWSPGFGDWERWGDVGQRSQCSNQT